MIQPGGTRMRTTHAMDLLLQKLSLDVCMAHRLPGLFNNPLSSAVLVIGHGIGGKVSQLKWRDLLKACCWSKQCRSVVTQSHSHSTSDGYEIQVCQRHVLYGIPYVGYPLPH